MAGFFSKLMGKAGSATEPTPGASAPSFDTVVPGSTDPFDADLGQATEGQQVIYQVASVLMLYPDTEIQALIPELRQLAQEVGETPLVEAIDDVAHWYESAPMEDVAASYVQEYDLSRRHSFHLSYWTEGDTRRRGEALTRFKKMYRDSGMVTNLHGELPDYLPLVLEFTALVDSRAGRASLQAYRPSLELLRLALRDDNLAFHKLVECICDSLPGESPQTAQEIQKLARATPPAESVGLDPTDPRLLPLLQPAPVPSSLTEVSTRS
ncbi:nitrate reductase molybdenum cofactor assembly chaperone [Rothia sp. ZJ932]|uniref:nitrate reductase molybdenum cofactor assembly chaperone n=1 Tax=Rothia sp. ZJ932 TaxID=2810516 RepID=UPI001966DC47|nr:nitrate reductase molybdenum cofactor assembly chaperone [Rothia sp. ZJ932]QRZ62063.1 nitrate reductase molybdenum cofactor assembly chaperone [Rothia sp. ZJ932]